ncbi:unnamed protein product [Vitrella brassicaformis CCMP3155]|uniref:PABC domain-containing protein n=1 Tax=Vitrella brassicaformis (strain CCMP3155) TaxID=1169540 RepID=A0A0G4EUU1_VITBC|nr:unnamed protein product [Vitrella brassicaformis CCMP3155]|mmetsp:Transcript_33983/g.83988  ORF Transcript_33983/g.83988 Transcript_33983/m.83988 type:complete len:354 (-) Transcript_33983:133-1194(-)|eukprot:CEM02018.1 unnamed protein product [Vitrella brassicaformis CCMP3155]
MMAAASSWSTKKRHHSSAASHHPYQPNPPSHSHPQQQVQVAYYATPPSNVTNVPFGGHAFHPSSHHHYTPPVYEPQGSGSSSGSPYSGQWPRSGSGLGRVTGGHVSGAVHGGHSSHQGLRVEGRKGSSGGDRRQDGARHERRANVGVEVTPPYPPPAMPGAKESPKPLIIPDGGGGAGGGRNNTAKHDTSINGSSNAKQTHKRGDDSKIPPPPSSVSPASSGSSTGEGMAIGDRRGLGVFQHESVQQLGVWLVDMPVENRKQALGDVIFPKVYHLLGGKDTVLYLAQKVTGMLLDLDLSSLLRLLDDPADLDQNVKLAFHELRTANATNVLHDERARRELNSQAAQLVPFFAR